MRAVLTGHGISTALPPGWEGRVYRRTAPTAAFDPAGRVAQAAGSAGGTGWAGEQPQAIVHLGNFPLPADRGDYGGGALERMGRGHVFVGLLEFGPECLGSALFAPPGLPRPLAEEFDPNALQRRLPGQAGYQRFCTVAGRPFCLYVVLGDHADAASLTARANAAIDGITVSPR